MAKENSTIKEHKKPPKKSAKGGKLLQHKHCQICSKAIPLSEEFCSEECSVEFDKLVRKRKNMLLLIYGSMIFFIIILFLSLIPQ